MSFKILGYWSTSAHNWGFFREKTTGTTAGRVRMLKSIIGKLPISEKQVGIITPNGNSCPLG
jgi:hypothetical protein